MVLIQFLEKLTLLTIINDFLINNKNQILAIFHFFYQYSKIKFNYFFLKIIKKHLLNIF